MIRHEAQDRSAYDLARTKDRDQWHSTTPGGPAYCVGCWWCSGSFEEWVTTKGKENARGD